MKSKQKITVQNSSQEFVLSPLDDALLCRGMSRVYVTVGGRDTSTIARYTVLSRVTLYCSITCFMLVFYHIII